MHTNLDWFWSRPSTGLCQALGWFRIIGLIILLAQIVALMTRTIRPIVLLVNHPRVTQKPVGVCMHCGNTILGPLYNWIGQEVSVTCALTFFGRPKQMQTWYSLGSPPIRYDFDSHLSCIELAFPPRKQKNTRTTNCDSNSGKIVNMVITVIRFGVDTRGA